MEDIRKVVERVLMESGTPDIRSTKLSDIKNFILYCFSEDIIPEIKYNYDTEDILNILEKMYGSRRLYYSESVREYCFVMDVKYRGLPDYEEIANILAKRLGIDDTYAIEKQLENLWEVFNDVVETELRNLSEMFGVEVGSFGRSGGYWGIPLSEIKLIYDSDKLSRKVTNAFMVDNKSKIQDIVNQFETGQISDIEFSNALSDLAKDYVYGEGLYSEDTEYFANFLYKYIKSGDIKFNVDLDKFLDMVSKIVNYWEDQEHWVDAYEPYIKY